MTREQATKFLKTNKNKTLWFTDGMTFDDMYAMLRYRMQFGEAESL